MTSTETREVLKSTIMSVFQSYASGVEENFIDKIEKQSGIKFQDLSTKNVDYVMNIIISELSMLIGDYKARFVAGVIKNILSRKGLI